MDNQTSHNNHNNGSKKMKKELEIALHSIWQPSWTTLELYRKDSGSVLIARSIPCDTSYPLSRLKVRWDSL
jgi:hypothetical protein